MASFTHSEGLTYNDVLLVPQFSNLASRREANISSKLPGGIVLQVPVISANMDTVTEAEMAKQMWRSGGMGILHRYANYRTVRGWIQQSFEQDWLAVPSIGVKQADLEFIEGLLREDCPIRAVCLDIAHAHSDHALVMIRKIKIVAKQLKKRLIVIAGNVATGEGTHSLTMAGADIIKVGIGGGAVCSTRINTGHGVPQLSAVMECSSVGAPIIADGGLKTSGDICKALAAGAVAVMTGSMLAGCPEAPNVQVNGKRVYRGMASKEAQEAFRGQVSNDMPEGACLEVATKSYVAKIMMEIAGGLRSGLSYSGAHNLSEFREKAMFMKITAHGGIESSIHFGG